MFQNDTIGPTVVTPHMTRGRVLTLYQMVFVMVPSPLLCFSMLLWLSLLLLLLSDFSPLVLLCRLAHSASHTLRTLRAAPSTFIRLVLRVSLTRCIPRKLFNVFETCLTHSLRLVADSYHDPCI